MTPLDPQPRPLDHMLVGKAGLALRTRDEALTYAEAEAGVARLAEAIAHLPAGARVATWLPKTVEACLMPLAAARAGLVHVPINPVLKRAQVAHILHDSAASLLLTAAARLETLLEGDLPQGCRVWREDEAQGIRSGSGKGLPPSSRDPAELVALLYTSGSTGRPKGVMLSHANLWLGAVSVAHYLGLHADDVILAILPLGFDYGQNQLFSTWYAGATVVPFDYLLPRDVVRAVAREGVTTLAAVPPLWTQLVDMEWGSAGEGVRRLTNSGGALTPRLIDALRRTFPHADIVPMYGLTEAFRSTFLPPDLVAAHPTSIGRAIPFAEVMVVDAEGKAAEQGELVHAGPLVAQGYWRDVQRTAERFRPAPCHSRYGGMAIWSGDRVSRDADGLLYFEGREDEMIKTSGHRVSPSDVEEAALATRLVREAVAHGIPDERLGQAIRLVVSGSGDEATLLTHLKRELPSFMLPREISWRDELPRNSNGKLDRSAIRAEAS